MKTRNILTLCATIGLLVLTPVLRLQAEPPSYEAIEQLEKALHSGHPIEHLEHAKLEIEEAVRLKHWDRAEALHQVHEAIEAARKDEHHRMEEHIGRAIHEIKEGRR